jgi:hypothetical protein
MVLYGNGRDGDENRGRRKVKTTLTTLQQGHHTVPCFIYLLDIFYIETEWPWIMLEVLIVEDQRMVSTVGGITLLN